MMRRQTASVFAYGYLLGNRVLRQVQGGVADVLIDLLTARFPPLTDLGCILQNLNRSECSLILNFAKGD